MKAYYTDPLAAAWMLEKFGMKFDDNSIYIYQAISGEIEYPKIYIHPDSMGILEPIEDDLIDMRPDGVVCVFLKDEDYDVLDANHPNIIEHFISNAVLKGDVPMIETSWSIIQRNNTAFMWPEFEGE
jgi:hypothetical protein